MLNVALTLSATEQSTFIISDASKIILLPDIISKLLPTGIGASFITCEVSLLLLLSITVTEAVTWDV